ncbi:L-amino acid N-acyltransferase YncA [Salana multivorans]|uniref:L-amino acid N-acyltransferase YncA n=1 Tax=Salana multivorans TaxID=120377 RepID=A0A3N2D314_9MICO|nr:L-amino acid N-acyltransferase YncA [Salana multivorans]
MVTAITPAGAGDNGSVTTADVSVRPALPSDLPAIARIQLAAWADLLGPDVADGLDAIELERQWAAALSDPDPRRRVLVALAGPRVVGFAAASPTQRSASDDDGWTGELVALEVEPTSRRAGHGSRLLAAAVDLARDAGAHHLGAWTMTHDPDRRAFLEGAGFAEAGLRRTLELPGPREVEEILLTAVLSPA